MSGYVLLDMAKREHEERIRRAERERLFLAARRAQSRPVALKSLLLWLARS